MENRITGRSPERIPDEEVDLSENIPASELCEEVKRLTAETREALLEQALAVSNEKCNGLILQLNARVTDLTRQVRSVKWMNEELASSLKNDAEKLTKEMKEENRNMLASMRITLQRITETVTKIQEIVNTTIAKATDEAGELLKERVTEAADDAAFIIDEHSKSLTKKVEELQKDVNKAREDIRLERGFRKFFFWLTPALLLAQSIMTAILLLR